MEKNKVELLREELNKLEEDLAKWTEKGNKSACKRARLTCSKIAKELKELRKWLLEESKSN